MFHVSSVNQPVKMLEFLLLLNVYIGLCTSLACFCQLVVAEQLELQVACDNQLTDIPCQFFVEMTNEELLHKTSFHFRGIVALWCKLCEK